MRPFLVGDRSARAPLSLTGGSANRLIDSDAVLPNTGQVVPSELSRETSISVFVITRQLNDGWITGGGVSIGSASDHPFATIREIKLGINGMLRIPQGEHNAWVFMVMYSPTSQLNFPIPMIAFNYNPSPQFHANIGLPLQVVWRPTNNWQFQGILRAHFHHSCEGWSALSRAA